MHVLDHKPCHERREGEHGAVVGGAERGPALEEMRERRRSGGDDHAGRPAEQDDRGDREDEAERDAAGAHSLHRHREPLGHGHAGEQAEKLSQIGRRGRCPRVPIDGECEGGRARDDHGHDD